MTEMTPDVAAAIAALKASGLSAEQITDLVDDTPVEPPPAVPAEVEYARDVVFQVLNMWTDWLPATQVTGEIIDRLVAQGLTFPPDWADRPPGAALQAAYPTKGAKNA